MSNRRQHRPLVTVAAFIVVVAGMKAAQPILVPFLLSLFIAIVCGPLMAGLKKRGMPEPLALGTVLGGVVVVGMLVFSLIGSSVQSFTQNVPKYGERLGEYQESLTSKLAPVQEWLEKWTGPSDDEAAPDEDAGGEPVEPAAEPADEVAQAPATGGAHDVPKGSGTAARDQKLLAQVDLKQWGTAALRTAAGTFAGLTGVLTNFFLILITVIFILLEAAGFPRKLQAALEGDEEPLRRLNDMADTVNRYMALKTVISLGTGLLAAAFLALLGVDYALLWGLLAFFLNFIPNIGSILAAIPPVLLALIQFGPGKALAVAIGYVALNVGIGSILEPRVMGRGLGLSTLVVFLSLIFWGWVLGPVGMLLSVPLTMALKIGLESQPNTRWIAILLGSEASARRFLEEEGTPSS